MTMPTIEDFVRAKRRAEHDRCCGGAALTDLVNLPVDESERRAMRAVLDALQPVVAEAFAAGDRKIPGYGERPEGYAARIIAQLKGESRD